MSWLRRLLFDIRERWNPATPPPPPPDTTLGFNHPDEAAIDILYSATGDRRVVISRDRRGLIRLHRELWDTGDWEVVRDAFWAEYGNMVTITDSIENARRLAEIEVRQLNESRQDVEQADAADEVRVG